MLFYQIGEYFQDMRRTDPENPSPISWISGRYANVKEAEIVTVDPQEIRIGDVIVIKPEKIPLDGKVLEGRSMIDTSALTGESVPREVEAGIIDQRVHQSQRSNNCGSHKRIRRIHSKQNPRPGGKCRQQEI